MFPSEGRRWRESMGASSQQTARRSNRLSIVIAVVLLSIVILVGAVFASLGNFSSTSPATTDDKPSSIEAKGLHFIQDVLSIDTSKYNVSIKTLDSFAPSFATPEQLALAGTLVDYDLSSNMYAIKITCTFIKNALTMCSLDPRNDTIASIRWYSNLTDIAKGFLINYQAFSGQNCTSMIETLTNINPTNDVSLIFGNLKLTTTHKDLSNTAFGDNIEFRWAYTYNGCDYPAIVVAYRNGVFSAFKDERSVYTIGDTTVNISRKQATDIALSAIKNYSYEMSGGVWISDFGVNGTNTYLAPAIRNSTYLCPCWTFIAYLDKTYPGSVSALVVYVWADSGKTYGTESAYVPGYGELT